MNKAMKIQVLLDNQEFKIFTELLKDGLAKATLVSSKNIEHDNVMCVYEIPERLAEQPFFFIHLKTAAKLAAA